MPGYQQGCLRGGWSIAEGQAIAAISAGPETIQLRPIQQKPLLTLRWTFTAKRACVVVTDSEPDRLAPLPPPAPLGLRGVWVVAARCCAGASERSFSCPSASAGEPPRRSLHPKYGRRQPAAASTAGGRIRSRRGCCDCCTGRAGPPSRRS